MSQSEYRVILENDTFINDVKVPKGTTIDYKLGLKEVPETVEFTCEIPNLLKELNP